MKNINLGQTVRILGLVTDRGGGAGDSSAGPRRFNRGPAKKTIRTAGTVAGVLMACNAVGLSAQPPLAVGADAQVSEDGLHRVAHSVMDAAWVKPDLNLAQYTKVYFLGTGISFREVRDTSYRSGDRTDRSEFAVDADSRQELRTLFRDTLRADLAEVESYQLTDMPGRDVLIAQGFLVDVVSHVPPDFNVGTTLRTTWEATLVLELRDSMSHDMLARTVERERPVGAVEAADLRRETRQLIRRWSGLLCERLEEVSEISVF